jgi:hypothetical protein
MSFETRVQEDCRLIILKELSRQLDYRLNETLLTVALETFGHRKPREYVREQIKVLEALDAVTVVQAGTVMVATITRRGLDHVERRTLIEGVARPSPEA